MVSQPGRQGWIPDPPLPAAVGIHVASRFAFVVQNSVRHLEDIQEGTFMSRAAGLDVELRNGITLAVDVEVEPVIDEVLVMGGRDPGSHQM